MKTITIAYWHCSRLDPFKWEHNTVLPYSTRSRNAIIDKVLNIGHTVTAMPSGETLIIWICKGKPGQR